MFGWKFQKWDGPWTIDRMVTTGDEKERGINGGISKRGQGAMPAMNTIGVPNIDQFSKKVKMRRQDAEDADPGVGWFAACQDTEGNMFGIIQKGEKAK